jgi:hypothetical protein
MCRIPGVRGGAVDRLLGDEPLPSSLLESILAYADRALTSRRTGCLHRRRPYQRGLDAWRWRWSWPASWPSTGRSPLAAAWKPALTYRLPSISWMRRSIGRCSARTATGSASTPRSSRRPTRPLPCGTPLASWCFSPRTRCLMPAEHGKPSGQVLAQSPSMMACNPGWPSSRSARSSQVGSSSYHRPGSGPMPAGSSTCRC